MLQKVLKYDKRIFQTELDLQNSWAQIISLEIVNCVRLLFIEVYNLKIE